MRVVIATTFLPFHEGGADKIVDDLERELVRRGVRTDTVRIPLHPSVWSGRVRQAGWRDRKSVV